MKQENPIMASMNNKPNNDAGQSFLMYATDDGAAKVNVRVENETVWLTQAQMAELFGVGVPTVNYHLQEVFSTGELTSDATIRKIRTVRKEGTRMVARELEHPSQTP